MYFVQHNCFTENLWREWCFLSLKTIDALCEPVLWEDPTEEDKADFEAMLKRDVPETTNLTYDQLLFGREFTGDQLLRHIEFLAEGEVQRVYFNHPSASHSFAVM